MAGPLSGLTIVEMAGIGPAPFAAMMLADHGAEVIRVERKGMIGFAGDPLRRSRRSIALDLKIEDARAIVRSLCARADALIEGYRPGVMERLGLGPADLTAANPRLVFARITGWGQSGPLAHSAGHDIDYLALTGLLHSIGPAERPLVPLNCIADYGGGGMLAAFGILAALLEARTSGQGQVIDVAMSDGAALLGATAYGLRSAGHWSDRRESNLLDGGSPTYAVYRCADGKFLAVGAIEPQFREAFLAGLGIAADSSNADIARVVATRDRDDWVARFSGLEACVAPVLDMGEAPDHPHNKDRATFIAPGGIVQPAPAPRFSRTRGESPDAPCAEGRDSDSILHELGMDAQSIAELRRSGAVQ